MSLGADHVGRVGGSGEVDRRCARHHAKGAAGAGLVGVAAGAGAGVGRGDRVGRDLQLRDEDRVDALLEIGERARCWPVAVASGLAIDSGLSKGLPEEPPQPARRNTIAAAAWAAAGRRPATRAKAWAVQVRFDKDIRQQPVRRSSWRSRCSWRCRPAGSRWCCRSRPAGAARSTACSGGSSRPGCRCSRSSTASRCSRPSGRR